MICAKHNLLNYLYLAKIELFVSQEKSHLIVNPNSLFIRLQFILHDSVAFFSDFYNFLKLQRRYLIS